MQTVSPIRLAVILGALVALGPLAIGGGATVVIAFATVRDHFKGRRRHK